MKTLKITSLDGIKRLNQQLSRQSAFAPKEQAKVAAILGQVRRGGDKALLALAKRLDGFSGSAKDLRLSKAAVTAAYGKVDKAFLKALDNAIANVQAYQSRLIPRSWRAHLRPGVLLGQRVRPIQRVGIYVPGGAAPLVSTVVMTAVPAKVAGVPQLILASPARQGAGIDARIIVAAHRAGVQEILCVGGAQAIAAMAYGTKSIAPVDKVVGPGNRWVTMAKQQVFGTVGIDMLAGPSEALVLADDSAPVEWVAADLLSQAEHAGDETAVLVTPSTRLVAAIKKALEAQLKALPRRSIAAASLKKHGLIILTKDMGQAVAVANAIAPEHLQLMVRNAEKVLPRITAAGAIFMGPYTPVALGDFLAGPSHVLPTGGSARFSNGLSVEDFVTKSSIVSYSRQALSQTMSDLEQVGGAEGLQAHVRSGSIRLKERA